MTFLAESPVPSKDKAPCCLKRRDDLGRLPIGYCAPSCIRRPDRWRTILKLAGQDPKLRAQLERQGLVSA